MVPTYKQAEKRDTALLSELQQVLCAPYEEQSPAMEEKYYSLRPDEFIHAGGVAHYSCSS